jgi:hypothetical protein
VTSNCGVGDKINTHARLGGSFRRLSRTSNGLNDRRDTIFSFSKLNWMHHRIYVGKYAGYGERRRKMGTESL